MYRGNSYVLSMIRPCALGLLLLASGAARLASANVVVGTTNTDNVFPFGFTEYNAEYQQIYDSAAFNTPMWINGLDFASLSGFGNAGALRTLDITLSLSTSSATLQTMSSNLAANRGPDYTQVFSGVINYMALGTNAFDLKIPTAPFRYDPSMGNLLMDLNIVSGTGNDVSFAATSDAVTTRAYNLGDGWGGIVYVFPDSGLVTLVEAMPVPEPATIAFFALGLAALGLLRRRQ